MTKNPYEKILSANGDRETRGKRIDPDERREQILIAAIELSKRVGYHSITRDGVAQELGISHGLINNYFDTIEYLKKEVMRESILKEVLEIIAQGFGMGDEQALKINKELKDKVLQFLSNQ